LFRAEVFSQSSGNIIHQWDVQTFAAADERRQKHDNDNNHKDYKARVVRLCFWCRRVMSGRGVLVVMPTFKRTVFWYRGSGEEYAAEFCSDNCVIEMTADLLRNDDG
jgi:hypothetical protein